MTVHINYSSEKNSLKCYGNVIETHEHAGDLCEFQSQRFHCHFGVGADWILED